MIYSCMIVDDEPLAHKVLLEYICKTDNLEVVKQAYSAEEARAYLSAHPVDILFLDIEMPEESGISFLISLPDKPVTVFTTAHIHYSLEGFELGVLDYLVKPIRYERFKLSVSRAAEFIRLYTFRSQIEQTDKSNEILLVKTGNGRKPVSKNSITHIQAMKDYAIIYCGNDKYVVRSTMNEMGTLLGSSGFIRVHKSFIVSKQKAIFYAAGKIEFNGFEIPVGRKYKAALDAILI